MGEAPPSRGRMYGASLFRYLVQGFGWRVGARAADEALEELERKLPEEDEPELAEPEPPKPPGAVKRWAAARAAKQAERQRKAEAARAEREIDDELEALKKKIND